jgi:hypothetical protein
LTADEWEIWEKKRDLQGRLPWTGEWPGIDSCRELGLWCYQDQNGRGKPEMHYGHIPCGEDHPNAGPDLNRLYSEYDWDKGKKKFVPKVHSD